MALSPELSNSTCEEAAAHLKKLMEHRMPLLAEMDGAAAGVFHRDTEEYVVLLGTTGSPAQGFLIVADKLLPFVGDRTLFLAILDRLNRRSLLGIHQLLDHPGGVIYLYKQVFCTEDKLLQPVFDRLLEDGVREFRAGLRYICQELETVLAVNRGFPGSRMGTDRN